MFAISLSSTSHTHTAYTTSAVRPSARRRGQRHWCYRMHIRVPELWLNCILNNVIKLISRNIPLPYCCYYVCIVLYIRRSSISIIFPLSSVIFFTRTSGTLANCNITGGPEYPVHFIHNSLGAMLLFIILSRHGSLCVCACGASLDEHTNFIFAFTGSLFLSLISLLLAAANVCDGPFYAVRFNSSRLQSFHCAAANSEQSLGRSHPVLANNTQSAGISREPPPFSIIRFAKCIHIISASSRGIASLFTVAHNAMVHGTGHPKREKGNK